MCWLPGGSVVKSPPANAGDAGDTGTVSVPGLGRWRSPGGGNGNLLQDSCLGNPMDRGAWSATVHGGCRKSQTQRLNNNIIFIDTGKRLINFTVHLQLKNLGNLRIERNFLNLKKRHLPENYSKHHRKTLEALPWGSGTKQRCSPP